MKRFIFIILSVFVSVICVQGAASDPRYLEKKTVLAPLKNQKKAFPGRALEGKKVAILVTDGFEQVEMVEPRNALIAAGAKTYLIAPFIGKVKGWKKAVWGDKFHVDDSLATANPNSYDALLLPGGVMSPDKLRMNNQAVSFVKHFVESDKPIAAICHGPWTLINAGAVKGRKMTSWPSLQADLTNAGALWVDQEVVRDKNLVTSRKPQDIPAFNREIIELFSKSVKTKSKL